MKKLILLSIIIFTSCNAGKTSPSSSDTRTKNIEFLDQYTFLLTESSQDKTYGYEKSNPINVGGIKESEGPLNQRRFLEALYGPNDKKMIYWRNGSCCAFETKSGFGGLGMLDIYSLVELGGADTLTLYLNFYDEGDLKIPLGLRAKERK